MRVLERSEIKEGVNERDGSDGKGGGLPGKKLWVDGGRHEHHLQVRATPQHRSKQTQQEIAPGVSLVHL